MPNDDETLHAINQRLEATLNALPDLLFEVGADGRILSYRAPADTDLYAPPEAFLGRNLADVLPPDVAVVAARAVAETFEKGHQTGAVYALDMGDEIRWFELSSSRVGEATGPDARLIMLVRNITRRKLAEDALRASERRLLESLRVARMGCWEYDVDAGVFQFDDQYLALHRTTAAAVGGHSMTADHFARNFVHPDDAHLVGEAIAAAIKTTDPAFQAQANARILCADGTPRWVTVWFRIEKDAAGRTIRLAGVNQDIHEHKLTQEAQERLQAQLLQSQKMESVGRLAGGVAHDFNNMLQAILGHVDLVLDETPADSGVRDSLLEIQKAARRSADLTRQLLAFARKQTVSPRVLDLTDTATGMLKLLRRLIGEDIDVDLIVTPSLWPIRIDPAQLDQVLANLSVNARDAIRGTGRITLRTANVTIDADFCAQHAGARPGDFVLLSVSDTGCGMSREVLEHLFEPFFTTKEVGKGTGLGLATVYGIVSQNDGFILVESDVSRGTSVDVYFPRHAVPVEPPAAPADASQPRGGSETILIVEDEDSILTLARTILERQGYRVLTVRTPGAAIECATVHDGAIDLLLSDVVMPEMNGPALTERLSLIKPGLRCLYMSGYTSDVIAHSGVLDEGVHFVAKPFSAAALAEKVREAIDDPLLR